MLILLLGANQSWGKGSRRRIGRVVTSYYVGGAQGSGGTPNPLSTDGFGMSLSCQTAAWYEGAASYSTGFRWEATGSSNSANTTWWNKVTISRSGQTDVVLLRSAATTNAMANYRYSIFWPSLIQSITFVMEHLLGHSPHENITYRDANNT